jgi:hypothetical protein
MITDPSDKLTIKARTKTNPKTSRPYPKRDRFLVI